MTHREIYDRLREAVKLMGKNIHFAHDPTPRRVTAVTSDGMIEIEGMSGQFAPHTVLLCEATPPSVAQEDSALIAWLLGITNGKPNPAGDFLRSLADAALRADAQNYPELRPSLLAIQKKYPKYCDTLLAEFKELNIERKA